MNDVRRGALVLIATLLAHFGALADDVVVVVGSRSPIAKLDGDQVTQVFLSRSNSLPGVSGPVMPIDQEPSALRDAFYQKVTGKSASQIAAIRANLIFSGKGKPPRVVTSSNELVNTLAENPNAISYVDKSTVTSAMKVVLTP